MAVAPRPGAAWERVGSVGASAGGMGASVAKARERAPAPPSSTGYDASRRAPPLRPDPGSAGRTGRRCTPTGRGSRPLPRTDDVPGHGKPSVRRPRKAAKAGHSARPGTDDLLHIRSGEELQGICQELREGGPAFSRSASARDTVEHVLLGPAPRLAAAREADRSASVGNTDLRSPVRGDQAPFPGASTEIHLAPRGHAASERLVESRRCRPLTGTVNLRLTHSDPV